MAIGKSEISLIVLIIFAMLSPVCIGTSPSLPFDKISAQVTVISVGDSNANLRIDRIDSYIKGPVQAAPQVEVGQEIKVVVYYVAPDNDGPSSSDIIAGQEYSADIQYCVSGGGLTCNPDGWRAAIYSARQFTSPSIRQQEYLLLVGFLLVLAGGAYILSKKRKAKQKIVVADTRKADIKKSR